MQFPPWVNNTRGAQKQARARLHYIIMKLAVECSARPSLRELARHTELCDYTTISYYIKKGAFTEVMAKRFEKYFGKKVLRAEMLTDPMSILSVK